MPDLKEDLPEQIQEIDLKSKELLNLLEQTGVLSDMQIRSICNCLDTVILDLRNAKEMIDINYSS